MLGVSTADQTNLRFRLAYQVSSSHLLPADVSDECWCRVGFQQTMSDRGLDCTGLSVLMLDVTQLIGLTGPSCSKRR